MFRFMYWRWWDLFVIGVAEWCRLLCLGLCNMGRIVCDLLFLQNTTNLCLFYLVLYVRSIGCTEFGCTSRLGYRLFGCWLGMCSFLIRNHSPCARWCTWDFRRYLIRIFSWLERHTNGKNTIIIMSYIHPRCHNTEVSRTEVNKSVQYRSKISFK